MRLSKTILLIVTCAAMLSGCDFWKHDKPSVVSQMSTSLHLVGSSNNISSKQEIFEGLNSLGEDIDILDNKCFKVKKGEEAFHTLGISLSSAGLAAKAVAAKAVKVILAEIFSTISGILQSRADELAARRVHSYTVSLPIDPPSNFGLENQCLILIRSHTGSGISGSEINFVLAVKVELRGKKADYTNQNSKNLKTAFVLKPVFLYLNKAVAVTDEGKGIHLIFALSGQLVRGDWRYPIREDIVLGSFTVPDVYIDENKAMTDFSNLSSGLIARMPYNAHALELRVAVVEIGSAVPDAERAKFEVKALVDSLSPVSKINLVTK